MTPIRSLLALALVAVSAQAPAAIGCSSGTSTLYHLNFPPSAPDLEPALGLPGGAGQAAEVLTVITRAGVAAEERVQEVNLDLEDLAFDAPAYNASVRDYRDGVLTMDVCVPGDAASILSHVTYRDGSGALVGFYSAAATPREGPSGPTMAAVADRAGTARLGRSFNEGGAEVMRDWIEADTGVRPPRSTAEALFSAAQAYVLGVAARSDALAHPVDASRGAREGSALLVTGSNSDWWASSAYSDITTLDGNSLLGPSGRLQDLEDRVGQTLVGHTPSGVQPIPVVDARAELEVSAGECDGDAARLQASLTNPSPLTGTVVLMDGTGRELARGEAIDEAVACGATYEVEAFRTTPRGQALPGDTETVSVAEAQTDPVIKGIDIDGDGAVDYDDSNGDGVIDVVQDIDCNAPFPAKDQLIVEPAGNYSYSGFDLPNGMNLNQGSGKITYDPPCEDAGNVNTPQFSAVGGGKQTPLMEIQYRVN